MSSINNDISQLKKIILDNAIRGKLVPQNKNDEDVGILLEKIKAEKEKLIKEGKIKTDKLLPEIKPDELEKDLPQHWAQVKMGDSRIVKIIRNGKQVNQIERPTKYKITRIETISYEVIDINRTKYFEVEDKSTIADYLIKKGDILFSHINSDIHLGKTAIADQDYEDLFHGINLLMFRTDERVLNPEFLNYYFKYLRNSGFFINICAKAVNQASINISKLSNIVISLPPLSEQQRIVAKIETLFKLADEIDSSRISLVEKVKQLKSAILQEAITGKLVPQDENDEDAGILLEKIKAEKEKLIKEGKIKKENPLPEIKSEEIPFEIPKSWRWVRLGDIGQTSVGLTYSPKDISNEGIPVLRSTNIQNNQIYWGELVRVNKEIPERLNLRNGDIIICARNGSPRLVGKSAQIFDLKEKVTFGAFMAYYRSICNNYIIYFINSKEFRKVLGDVNTTTINQITQNNLKEAIVPIPPLSEQQRIVAKIEELFKSIDEMVSKIE